MKQFLKSFEFSKNEQRGIFTLIGLFCILLSVKLIQPILYHFYSQQAELREIKAVLDLVEKEDTLIHPGETRTEYRKSTTEWKRSKSRFKDRLFETPENIKSEKYQKAISSYQNTVIDINTADSIDLLKLKGVGPFYAQKILKYRSRIGGFQNINQLLEIYRIDSLIVKNNSDRLRVGKDIKLINVNIADARELSYHPYLSWKQAKALEAYRNQHGPFNDIQDINNCVLIDSITYRKIAPYLTVK